MASIVVNATATLSANGASTATGSISWTPPSLPSGVTAWDSIVISGTWSWSGKGAISYVNINGTNTSEDVAFSISLGTSVSSTLSITCRGGNKNSSGSYFRWNNLVVTYNYTAPLSEKFYVKQNSTWVEASEVYKKVNGAWVLQTDLSAVIDSTKNYVKG